MKALSATLALSCGVAQSFQLPFKVPFLTSNVEDVIPPQGPPRIAIIGAGAGGSSAAFWISKAHERFGVDVQVDVFERESYVGGRSTTVFPYDNSSLPSIELGASIFVPANKNLFRASEEFNLSRGGMKDEEGSIGIWDGESVLVTIGGGWLDYLKAAWRYGVFSPRTTDRITQNMIKKFMNLYAPDTPKWDDVAGLSQTFGWTGFTEQTTASYFSSHGVSDRYIYEVIEAGTRVNYGQDADSLHALEGAVTMAASEGTSIDGGNWRVFEQFLNRSGANVFLDTKVQDIAPGPAESWRVTTDKSTNLYKGVILAAPYHQSGIDLPSSLSAQIPEQPYVHLHVTLLTTTASQPKPGYLNLPADASTPRFILTTHDGARKGGKEPEFNSVSYLKPTGQGDEWVVKIFSKEKVSDEWLAKLFGEGTVGWVRRKEWDAYPVLPPTTSFPPVRLDKGFFYVNSFEPFISTMETEIISARNVVDLLLNEEFATSICGPRISSEAQSLRDAYEEYQKTDSFVYGWDC